MITKLPLTAISLSLALVACGQNEDKQMSSTNEARDTYQRDHAAVENLAAILKSGTYTGHTMEGGPCRVSVDISEKKEGESKVVKNITIAIAKLDFDGQWTGDADDQYVFQASSHNPLLRVEKSDQTEGKLSVQSRAKAVTPNTKDRVSRVSIDHREGYVSEFNIKDNIGFWGLTGRQVTCLELEYSDKTTRK